jgi:hypothetical protein
VADPAQAADAGAASLHWHACDPRSGATTTGAALNGEIAIGVRERADLLLQPTLGGAADEDSRRRTADGAPVNDELRRRLDLAPIDFGSMNLDRFDAGFPHDEQTILGAIEALGRRPEELRRIILSHWHVDLFGSAVALRELTGAPILLVAPY